MLEYFLGVDLGSSFTKLCVTDGSGELVHRAVFPTLSRDRHTLQDQLSLVHKKYSIKSTCATGYGRVMFDQSDIKKTELVCSAVGASRDFPYQKTVIDIGGEDIKVITCNDIGRVEHFRMNDKCAAGTGVFIMELAEKAELEIQEMSRLAMTSHSTRELNSFCTVFAKTEILEWKFSDIPVEDLALGIYLSIVSRIMKLSFDRNLPVILCGGVIDYHPYIGKLLDERLSINVIIPEFPQYTSAIGATLIAMRDIGEFKPTMASDRY